MKLQKLFIKSLFWLLMFFVVDIFETKVFAEKSRSIKDLFPISGYTKEQVYFWEKVFYVYPSTSVIIHDVENVSRVYDVLDFVKLTDNKINKNNYKKANLIKVASKFFNKYKLALNNFATHGKDAIELGSFEKRIYNVYKSSPRLLNQLYQGKINIRIQTGLADEFKLAAQRAQNYLPFMEKTFREHRLPIMLTRLVFVESMFKNQANSSVGASGMWQFMKLTAKRNSLVVDEYVDERKSPYKATVGAAKLLKKNYLELKSWPLAITAYNHGREGMKNAVEKLGTNNIGIISRHYVSDTFKFASRNFYAEFYAAAKVYQKLLKNNKIENKNSSAIQLAAVELSQATSIFQILEKTNLTKATLRYLNRCLDQDFFDKKIHKKLPQNYKIYLPEHTKEKL